MRNVLVVVGNSKNTNYINTLKKYIHSEHELMSAHAIDALRRLMDEKDFAALKAEHREDNRVLCRVEWDRE